MESTQLIPWSCWCQVLNGNPWSITCTIFACLFYWKNFIQIFWLCFPPSPTPPRSSLSLHLPTSPTLHCYINVVVWRRTASMNSCLNTWSHLVERFKEGVTLLEEVLGAGLEVLKDICNSRSSLLPHGWGSRCELSVVPLFHHHRL